VSRRPYAPLPLIAETTWNLCSFSRTRQDRYPLTAEEFEEVKHHSLNSVRQILRLHAPQNMKARILLPPFEHHLKYDLLGYPRTNRNKPVSLFGRILAIADVFDAITSPRKYRPTSLSPDRAIRLMMEGAGKDFDPILLKSCVRRHCPSGVCCWTKGAVLSKSRSPAKIWSPKFGGLHHGASKLSVVLTGSRMVARLNCVARK
jgi:hypothetical protein